MQKTSLDFERTAKRRNTMRRDQPMYGVDGLFVLQDSFPNVSRQQILNFESRIGVNFPEEYRQFLLKHNGGKFARIVAYAPPDKPREESVLELFYAIDADCDWADLWHAYDVREPYLPANMIPIADNGVGGVVCIDTTSKTIAPVYRWDQHTGGCEFVTSSLRQYLSGLRYLLDEDWTETDPAFAAVERGNVTALLPFLEAAGTEQSNTRGQTLLAAAAGWEQPAVVKELIARGADVAARTPQGVTPFYLSSEGGAYDITRWLFQYGADIEAADDRGRTPLIAAISAGQLRTAKLLIEYGANVNAIDEDGHTPLSISLENAPSARQIAPLLRARGAIL